MSPPSRRNTSNRCSPPAFWPLGCSSTNRPYFLAGGLDPDNIADAIAALHPYGVDVSSGIETDGVKDESKMAAFVAAARKEG